MDLNTVVGSSLGHWSVCFGEHFSLAH